MKPFNSFYFLHIPKTGGRLYVFNFLDPLNDAILDSNIKNFKDRINSSDHSQWRKDITDSTYVTTLLRDPCKHAVSMYIHSMAVDELSVVKTIPKEKINKEAFLNWINKNEQWIKNYQSKHLVSPTATTIEEHSNIFLNNSLVTTENVFKKIDQISLIFKPEDLSENNVSIIQKIIMSDLGINNFKANNKPYQREHYRSVSSEFIYDSLTKKDKEYLLSISNIDSEVYETKKIFYTI
jgi:uncharacterized protein (DUF1499 family)